MENTKVTDNQTGQGRLEKRQEAQPQRVKTQMGWRAAQDLKPGDKIITKDGRIGTVKAVKAAPGLHTVHNFSVEHDHTYFVGKGPGTWVHNTGTGNGYSTPENKESIEKASENPSDTLLDTDKELAALWKPLRDIRDKISEGFEVVTEAITGRPKIADDGRLTETVKEPTLLDELGQKISDTIVDPVTDKIIYGMTEFGDGMTAPAESLGNMAKYMAADFLNREEDYIAFTEEVVALGADFIANNPEEAYQMLDNGGFLYKGAIEKGANIVASTIVERRIASKTHTRRLKIEGLSSLATISGTTVGSLDNAYQTLTNNQINIDTLSNITMSHLGVYAVTGAQYAYEPSTSTLTGHFESWGKPHSFDLHLKEKTGG